MKYAYPAILRPESGGFCVFFPDIEKGATQGDDLPDALNMAADWLAGTLCDMESRKEELPKPSQCKALDTEEGDIVTLVYADTIEYRRKFDNKAINKTLTIPNWLNTLAEEAEINFSQTLQKALKKKLKLQS